MLVHLDGDRAVRVSGDPDHPFTQGFLCTKVSKYVERTYHSGRVLHPLIRTGPKGSGEFRRASWEEALELTARRLGEIARGPLGPQAILPYSYAGTQGLIQGSSIDRRFFHLLGASKLARTICATAGMEALNVTYGNRMGTDSETVSQSRLIWLWGTNTLTSNPHLWPFILKARKAGARVVCIDPIRTRTAEQCDEHIAVRPGTDAALALGIAHVLFRDELVDQQYMETMTLGWEQLRDRVLRDYEPGAVDSICRLPAGTTERLAREYGTTTPSFIRLNYGMQRHAGGGNAVRAIVSLPALTGQWDHAGGGCQLSTSTTFPLDLDYLEREDLAPPDTRTINMSQLGDALTGPLDPPIRAVVVYNSNPGAVAPDLVRVRQGLLDENRFVVVLEHFLTDTCDYADVVFPATTQLEHWDLHKSYGHVWLMLNRPSIAAVGEALPNTEIFRRLARSMGMDDPLLQESDEAMIRALLDSDEPAMEGITFESLDLEGPQRLRVGAPHLPYASGTSLPTPSGRIEIASSELAARGLDPLPAWVAPWESEERSPELAARYPLTLLSPPAHSFLNSTFVNVASLRRAAGEPTVEIHPSDASSRGVIDGASVRVRNDRGSFQARATVTDRVRAGVVSAPSVWWPKLTGSGTNANDTTSQRLTDLGEGATFYDNLVEVELVAGSTTPAAGH